MAIPSKIDQGFVGGKSQAYKSKFNCTARKVCKGYRLNEGTGTPNSWRSSDTPDDRSLSLSPTSCATPSDPDVDFSYTIGVTESTPYACHFCEKAFPRLSYLKRHEQIHSDQMPFKCDYCQRLFKHKRSRDRHIKLHTGDKKYRCPHCESAFSRSDHLKIHMKTHDHAKPFQCTVCNRGYNTAAALTSHMQNHKKVSTNTSSVSRVQSQSFRCLQCSTCFASAKDLQNHIETHCDHNISSNDTRRPVHQELFPTLQGLGDHKINADVGVEDISGSVEVKKNYNKVLCGFCTKDGFSTLEALQLHVQAEHIPTKIGQLLLNSSTLFSLSSFAISLQQQSTVCNNNGSFSCEYCNTKFSNIHSLQKHTLSVHTFTDKVQENLSCSECSSLSEHLKTAHDERNGNQPASNRGTSTNASSERLDNFSMNEKLDSLKDSKINGTVPLFSATGPFLCSQCSAVFPDFESFRTHLKIHLDAVVKRYSCSECDAEFHSEEHLDIHYVTHFLATITEYGCRCCFKVFTQPDELQKHLMNTHAHQLYRCSLCKDLFDSKVNIQVHFAMKHSNECCLFQCTSCKVAFRSEVEFQLHVKVTHLLKIHPFRCLLCDQCFPTEFQLRYHMNAHQKQFACALCDEAFHVEFLLDKHVQTCHYEAVNDSFVGTVSNQSSISADGVQNLSLKPSNGGEPLVPSVHRRKDLRCEICDCAFSTEIHLSVHHRQIHNFRISSSRNAGPTALNLFCAYCNESCKSRAELENHTKAHTMKPSKNKCNICDEVCPTAVTLAEHKLNHCKVLTASTCICCRKTLQNEEEYYGHSQLHNTNGFPVPCVICRQSLMSDMEIQVHARFHLKNCDPVHPCCVCAKQFEVTNLVITGIQDKRHIYMCKVCFHARSEDMRCPECKVKFDTLIALDRHKLIHKKTYQCIKCQMSFESETEIQAHVTSHMIQEGTSHECKLCNTVFESPAKLQCHLIEHTFEGCSCYMCYMCSAVFTAPHLIQQHMLEHGLGSRPYDCARCHQKFFFRAELENHSYIHESNTADEKQPNHLDCSKAFNKTVDLNNHYKIYQDKNDTLKCSMCPKLFHNSADMQQHYFRCHDDKELRDGKKSFPCTECGKVFPCLSNLQGHTRIHAQGTKYTCPECKKEFALSRNLNIHMRSHSGEKPYECPICKKRFARKENRKAHLRSHTGLKPFMCPHCGKDFSRKCHVKEHMRIHITSTNFPCELCSETFCSLKQMKRHLVNDHHKQYDHVCHVCGDVFSQSKSLEDHVQKDHDVTNSNTENDVSEDLTEFSPIRSSTSEDITDIEGNETSNLVEICDPKKSPPITAQDNVALPPEVAA
ncbi:zinc finger protein 423-like [Limulus polyphemus]|uniref:Zinc finger protein 423-like n=1 Tax=Limulus polyphemus TaxID=6850 RepID=A0ABM1SW50_LIMPO|nr:zinc finger protein 423-like [Limulus polyphemus]